MTALTPKQQRAEHVNQVIRIIADHGRRFFFSASQQRYASMEVDERGRVWFIDDHSGRRVYTHRTPWGGRWRGFTHGGTLRALVEEFREYIRTGKQLHPYYLGPERERLTDGNIWGYAPEEMQKVRELAGAIPVFRQQEQAPLPASLSPPASSSPNWNPPSNCSARQTDTWELTPASAHSS